MNHNSKSLAQLAGKQGPKPTFVQRKYLKLGLNQPGGKLPLFDKDRQKVKATTIRACMSQGWCKPWFANPIEPSWLVCQLTDVGRVAVDKQNSKIMIN